MRTLDAGETEARPVAPDTERGEARTPAPVYNGATTFVTDDAEAARIRETLYRTDESALATIIPDFRPDLTQADIARFNDLGYLAMDGLLSAAEVADCKAALSDLIARRAELGDQIWVQEEPVFDQGRLRLEQRPRAARSQAGSIRQGGRASRRRRRAAQADGPAGPAGGPRPPAHPGHGAHEAAAQGQREALAPGQRLLRLDPARRDPRRLDRAR